MSGGATLTDSVRDLFVKIDAEWNKAEEVIKRAEQINGEVVTPAVKELRYTGRRLAAALAKIATGKPQDEIEPLLQDALHNCYRARHDAVDAAIAKVLDDIEIALDSLGFDHCVACYPSIHELVSDARKAQQKIASSRGAGAARDEVYQTLEAVDLASIASKYEDFLLTEKHIKARAKKERRERLRNTLFGAGGIVVGILGGAIALLAWLFPRTVEPPVSTAPLEQHEVAQPKPK